jgi:hypothetical protein
MMSKPNLATGSTYTFKATDSVVRFLTACTATVPAGLDLPDGREAITYTQEGSGQVTIVGAAGVTIDTPETLLTAKQHASCSLIRKARNHWVLAGNLQAAA